ncbi:MAG: SCO family protein [Planctomycetota bacterium]
MSRAVARPVLALAVLSIVLLGFTIGLALMRPRAGAGDGEAAQATTLPVMWTVPVFDLIERSGKRVTRDSLKGRVWIADFIFTSCANTCPVMTAEMKRIDGELPRVLAAAEQRPVLVSFSVDPDRDTPAALTQYATRIGASQDWLFLTGDRRAITALAVNGFKLAAVDQPEDFTHSSKLVLIDRELRIRGFYDGLGSESVDQLVRDAVRLVKGAP